MYFLFSECGLIFSEDFFVRYLPIVEFLTFVLDGKEDGVQVLYKDETIWATQKAMSILFDCSTDNIGLHLKNIFNSNELDVNSTTEKISVVQTEGDRDVNRTMTFYNLDAVISVGYRVNSLRATQFRQWTTNIIRQFAKQFAESEFEKYRIIQDRLFESDFDRFNQNLLEFPDDIQ